MFISNIYNMIIENFYNILYYIYEIKINDTYYIF